MESFDNLVKAKMKLIRILLEHYVRIINVHNSLSFKIRKMIKLKIKLNI